MAIDLSGTYGYTLRYDSDVVNLQAARIQNTGVAGSKSGTLRLELWATTQAYAGGELNGVRLGAANLGNFYVDNGRLAGGFQFNNVSVDTPWTGKPAPGFYNAIFVVGEYTGDTRNDGFTIADWGDFNNYLTIAPAGATNTASDGRNWLGGTRGADLIFAYGGDDLIFGGSGNDTLYGGTGTDTASFASDLSANVITRQGITLQLTVSGPDGTDRLDEVERLSFRDGTIVLDADPLIDEIYYARANRDVFGAGLGAQEHYNNWGWREARDPNPLFDTDAYLAANPDVARAGLNPLAHYRQFGWREGRDPSLSFDAQAYLMRNPDVRAAGIEPLTHYLESGAQEGRSAVGMAVGRFVTTGVDTQYYLVTNRDVAAAGMDPVQHYMTNGWREGRDPNAWFDTDGYLARFADVRNAGLNPLLHYLADGWREGRDPSPAFDTTSYLAAYRDVAGSGMNPLLHYLVFGHAEGRSTFPDGTWT